MVVGAPGEDSIANQVNGNANDNRRVNSGAAYVFVNASAGWKQEAYLKANNAGSGDGSTIAVSALDHSGATQIGGNANDTSKTDAGAVFLY